MKFNNSVTLAMTISETITFNGKAETAQIMSFEINPVKEEDEEGMTQCPEEEAEGFGVYARMQNGEAVWLADFDTKESANDLFHLMQSVYRLGKTSAAPLPDAAPAPQETKEMIVRLLSAHGITDLKDFIPEIDAQNNITNQTPLYDYIENLGLENGYDGGNMLQVISYNDSAYEKGVIRFYDLKQTIMSLEFEYLGQRNFDTTEL